MKELEAGLAGVLESPRDQGVLELIVRRPRIDAREVLETAELDTGVGLIGDNWRTRGGSYSGGPAADPDTQVTMMNARVIELLAGEKDRWALAGDQLYVDLDLSRDNLPPGTRVSIGSAVLEISARPHTPCKKFAVRYGVDAYKFVNSAEGRRLCLRGVNAIVVQSGTVRVGDGVSCR